MLASTSTIERPNLRGSRAPRPHSRHRSSGRSTAYVAQNGCQPSAVEGPASPVRSPPPTRRGPQTAGVLRSHGPCRPRTLSSYACDDGSMHVHLSTHGHASSLDPENGEG